jgi:hypothetical protein
LRIQTETPSNTLLLVETTVAVAAIVGGPPCFLSATKEEDNILSLSFRDNAGNPEEQLGKSREVVL